MSNQQKNILEVVHRPYGIEHPYEQDPSERFPRNPVDGDQVTIGVVTTPPGLAEEVNVTWIITGYSEEHTVSGKYLRDENESSYWQVDLPAFNGNQQLSYRVSARSMDLIVTSEVFNFHVGQWIAATQVISSALVDGAFILDLALENSSLSPRVHISVSNENRIHVGISGPGQANLEWSKANIPFERVENLGQSIRAWTDKYFIECQREPFILTVGSQITGKPILVHASLEFLIRNSVIEEVRQSFKAEDNEAFWGTGERFNSINQRGNEIDIRVYEEYKNQAKRTYIPMPFFISSSGYGVYLNTSRYALFDFASSQKDQWAYRAELGSDSVLEYDLIVGDPKQIISSYVGLTGSVVVPPPWAFGPWMSSNDWNNQTMIDEMVSKTQDLGIPASVLVIEAWSDEATFYIWNDAIYAVRAPDQSFRYDDFHMPSDGKWPNPMQMIDNLHDRGIRLILWQIPVLKYMGDVHPQHDLDIAYALEKGFCVLDANGDPYRVKSVWFNQSYVLDFTNPEAVEWWMRKREYLVKELGVDGFKTDGGEHIFGKDLIFSDGRRGAEIWNLYPNLYIGAYHQFARSINEQAITFSRAGFTGAQSIPCHWAGDENSTWEAYRSSIVAGITAGACGVFFWGWDIGGFSGDIPTAELYLRSVAMAAFCPIMQYHSEYNARLTPSRDRTPWNIEERTGDENIIPIFRKYANLRLNLIPYIYSEAMRCRETRLPLMRGMFIEDPEYDQITGSNYQYYFGSQLLIAPVVEPDIKEWRIYLPPGKWHDFWTGEKYSGGGVHVYSAPKDVIPVFAKSGAIIPMNLGTEFDLGSWVGNAPDSYTNLVFKLYPGEHSEYKWFDYLSGDTIPIEAFWVLGNEKIRLTISHIATDTVFIIICNFPSMVLVNGEEMVQENDYSHWKDDQMNKWFWNRDRKELIIKSPPGKNKTDIVILL